MVNIKQLVIAPLTALSLVISAFAVVFSLPAVANHEVHPPPAPFPGLPVGADFPTTDGEGNAIDVPTDVGTKGFHVSIIKDDVYWITDGNYHSMAIVHDTGVILVDAPEPLPFFPPMDVLGAVAEITNKPITHLIYSHGHSDHNGGAHQIKTAFPDVEIVAHKKTKASLKAAADPNRPVPTKTFDKKLILHAGGQKLVLSYHGNTHQEGNIFIYHPATKTLMVVDVIYPGWVPFRRLALSTDIAGWISGHDAVLSFDFDVLVGGHLTRLGNRDDAVLGREYVQDIQDSIEGVILDATTLFGAFGGTVGALEVINDVHDPGQPDTPPAAFGTFAFSTVAKWALFSAFYDVSVQRCADVLDTKYRSDMGGDPSKHLGGAETFNFSNCEAYFVARRIGTHKIGNPVHPKKKRSRRHHTSRKGRFHR